ncbi:MAG TPA: hypothetical protein VIE44_06960 [Methylomirabilota bacterium]
MAPRGPGPAGKGAAAALRALAPLRDQYAPGLAARKLEALLTLERARLGTAREVEALHEILCFLRAYPDSRALLALVTRMLEAFGRRPDLRRHARALENSGIAGTALRDRFFAPLARWLAWRWPARLRMDWKALKRPERLAALLPLLVEHAESPALDELPYDARTWVSMLKPSGQPDAAWLVQSLSTRLFAEWELVETLWDDLDPTLVLEPGPDTPSRTRAYLASAPRGAWQRRPLDHRRPDPAAELMRPPVSVRTLTPGAGERVIDLAREAMVTRQRDLDSFSYGDPHDVRMVDCGDGLAFACIGLLPERRLMLEAVYAFLTLKNGVPIGYMLNSALFNSAEIAYNVFETFRGAEAGFVYGRGLATVRHLFNVDTFTIYPYQLGDGNEEAIGSGAWWFYQKMGFRPKHPAALRIMDREAAAMRRHPGHRSSRATLRALARHNLYYHAGPARDDVIGLLPLANVGLHVTRLFQERFGGDRPRAVFECVREAMSLLGLEERRTWPRSQTLWWHRWAPLVMALPGVERWSGEERRSLAELILAKGGRHESDFVRRFDAHAPLRAALRALAERRPR